MELNYNWSKPSRFEQSLHRLLRPILRHAFGRKLLARVGSGFMIVDTEGKQFYCNLREGKGPGRSLIKYGCYEPTITRLVKHILLGGGCFIDIGANLGYFSVIASTVTPDRIHAFEPAPATFQQLERNTLLNNCDNVTLVNKALCEEPQSLKLYLNDFNHGDNRCFETVDQPRGTVEIEGICLDDYMQENQDFNRVSLIKMDVQGYEIKALRGMQKLLAANPAVTVISEYEPKLLREAGHHPHDFIHAFEKLGFNTYFIDEKDHHIQPVSTALLDQKTTHLQTANLLFSRNPDLSIKLEREALDSTDDLKKANN